MAAEPHPSSLKLVRGPCAALPYPSGSEQPGQGVLRYQERGPAPAGNRSDGPGKPVGAGAGPTAGTGDS